MAEKRNAHVDRAAAERLSRHITGLCVAIADNEPAKRAVQGIASELRRLVNPHRVDNEVKRAS